MRVVIEVIRGPSAGRKIEILPGQLIQVGRATWAEFSLSADPSMAGIHFSISCEETGCIIRAVHRTEPTFLNELKVREAPVYDGDRIVAGDNTFAVHVEGGVIRPIQPEATVPMTTGRPLTPAAPPPVTPARPASRPAPPPDPAADLRQELVSALAAAAPLYAIMDAARDPLVLERLQALGLTHITLYEGEEADTWADTAPYLVPLPAKTKALERLVPEAWGKSWGIFLSSTAPLEEIRKHLRHFLQAELPDGEVVLFRFYDPRVLRLFLPACNASEVQSFFGPVSSYLLEGDDPEMLVKLSATRKGVHLGFTIVKVPQATR